MGDLRAGDAVVHLCDATRCGRHAWTVVHPVDTATLAATYDVRQRETPSREDVMTMKRISVTGLSAAGLAFATALAFAAGQYGPGAGDTEIKIGNTMPYSGPA